MTRAHAPRQVTNDPSLGHHYPSRNIMEAGSGRGNPGRLDVMRRRKTERLGMSDVWLTLAHGAPDQLRQKVAWALSQQYVVSGDGFPRTHVLDFELWSNYHDIFVRHAFGNLRDILKEVSYSPVMGKYLTFQGSTSFAASGTYPDENYAREFMQACPGSRTPCGARGGARWFTGRVPRSSARSARTGSTRTARA